MNASSTTPRPAIAAVILAGGRASRMHGLDKGLVTLAGQPLVAHVISALHGQADELIISANRSHEHYAALAPTVVADAGDGEYAGPLAGIAAAMRTAQSPLLFTCPCDSPFLTPDIVARLWVALDDASADIAVAHDGQRPQPVFALMRCSLLDDLLAFLDAGERKIMLWYRQHALAQVDFSTCADLFTNINTPAECAAAERRLAAH